MAGTAVLGKDYTLSGTSGSVVIKAGYGSATVTLNSLSGSGSTTSPTATMTLGAGSGYTLSPVTQASVKIVTSSATPTPSPTVTPGPSPTPVPSPTPTATPYPTPTPTSTRDVWVSIRTDGKSGSGTQTDPYDGSTEQKFDGVFINYMNTGVTNVTFHIGPGTFNIKGGWKMLDGWHIQGSGKDTTTLYQGDWGDGTYFVVLGFKTGHENNLSVSDLAIDCAYFRLKNLYPTGNFAGVELTGSNSYVQNVRVLHSGSDAGESFAILIICYYLDALPNNSFIDNCEVLEPGANVSGLTISTYTSLANPATYAKNGSITNSVVNGANIGGGPPNGFVGSQFTGCTFMGCFRAIYSDTFPATNVLIANNSIQNCFDGVYLNNNNFSAVTVSGNTLSTTGGGITFTNHVTNATISGNRVITILGGNPMGIVLSGSGVNGINVSNNVIDVSPNMFFNTALNVTCLNNLTPTGVLAIPNTH